MAHKIEDLIDKILAHDQSWHRDLLRNWNTIIGPLYNKVQLEKIEDNLLILGVYDSCWMQELYLLTPLLLRTINQKLDQPRIKQLRFKTVGRHKKIEAQSKQLAKKDKIVVLNKHEQEALNNIKDLQLQEALKKFLMRCYQEKE